jgi:hypothetical protein
MWFSKKKKNAFKGTKSLNIAKMWFSQKLKNKVYAKNSFFFFLEKKKLQSFIFQIQFQTCSKPIKKKKKMEFLLFVLILWGR